MHFKLRFRRDGKQIVRYVGTRERAAAVKNELAVFQRDVKLRRDLKARVKVANKMLRESKKLARPFLEANGLAFHGLAIRRPRTRRHDVVHSNTKP